MIQLKKNNAASIRLPEKAHLPHHIAFIMDGNGRWAKKRSLPRSAGHSAGGDNFVETVGRCNDCGIEYMTVYAFSTENWSRSPDEVSYLVQLMKRFIVRYTPDLIKKNIRLRLIGDLSRFDPVTREVLLESERTLSSCTGMLLCVAISYGGRDEITHAVNTLIAAGKTNVTQEDIAGALYTAGIPDPDLIIRTSGEMRTSNFLLWQSAYSEYYFTEVNWPDFDAGELAKALSSYALRQRRFGKEK